MNIFDSMDGLSSIPGPLALAAGVFDGMHHGHRAVLHAALDAARESGGSAAVLTFDPLPSKILRPDRAPHLLTSTPHKLALMRELGIRHVLVIAFDEKFAALEAEDFLRRLSAAACSLRRICVGQGWKFGRAQRGDGTLLRALGPELGFETTEVSPVTIDGLPVSSTLIRQSVKSGDLDQAERLLGRRYSILGTVRHGEGLGRQLGFPTANLAAHNEQFPPDGVYAVRVRVGAARFPGVANIGTRPTVTSDGERLLEVHLLDFSENLYGQDIEAEFVRFLRPEKKFSGLPSLRDQIARDAGSARAIAG
ncbi:MAG: bifunctional riboflavin kinase/FAD synthetase [Verrucomicrobiae bacterium]